MIEDQISKPNILIKKHPRTRGVQGLCEGFKYSVFLNGKKCGLLSGCSGIFPNRYVFQISVKKENDNKKDEWDWIFPIHKAKTESDLVHFVIKTMPKIASEYHLHFFEPEEN